MRDDTHRWAPSQGASLQGASTQGATNQQAVVYEGVTLSPFLPARQTLISGPVAAALKWANLQEAVAWPKQAEGEAYALRLRRDQILVVNGPEREEGWNSSLGLAVSDMTDGFQCCTIEGENALNVLKRGTEIDPSVPSGSVSRTFAGFPVFIYSIDADGGYTMHIQRAYFDSLWALLGTYCGQAASAQNGMGQVPTT